MKAGISREDAIAAIRRDYDSNYFVSGQGKLLKPLQAQPCHALGRCALASLWPQLRHWYSRLQAI